MRETQADAHKKFEKPIALPITIYRMLPIAYNSDANLQTGVGRGGHHGKVLSTTKTLAFAGDTRDVGTAGGIPKRDVLLHALREASLFLGGDGRAGGGNAGVEAVLIHFLYCCQKLDAGRTVEFGHTPIRFRALAMAASCWSCLMMAVLTSCGLEAALVEPEPNRAIVLMCRDVR